MKTEFFLHIIPPTKTDQQKRLGVSKKGKAFVYKDAELNAVRSKLMANLAQHIPKQKYTTAVRTITKWCFPITGKHQNGEYKTSRPDTDNLQKMLKDVMTDLGFWSDDAIVASEIIEKFYSNVPGIFISIEELN